MRPIDECLESSDSEWDLCSDSESDYVPGPGNFHCGPAHRYGNVSTESAQFVNTELQKLIQPIMSNLDDSQNKQGIESLKWNTTKEIFDECSTIVADGEAHRRSMKLSSDKQSAGSLLSGTGRGGHVMLNSLEELVGDRDVLRDLSFDLNAAAGLLGSPAGEQHGAEALGTDGVKCLERTFLDISVLLYLDLDRPCIQVSRLWLVVCTKFNHKGKPPVSWSITGGSFISFDGLVQVDAHCHDVLFTAYDYAVYLPRPDLLSRLCNEAQRLGQQETQDLIPRMRLQ